MSAKAEKVILLCLGCQVYNFCIVPLPYSHSCNVMSKHVSVRNIPYAGLELYKNMNLLGRYFLKLLKTTLLSMHFSFLVFEWDLPWVSPALDLVTPGWNVIPLYVGNP